MAKNNLQKNIAMKDSGVEWIGEIPSDWDVSPLLRFFTISKDKVKEGVLNPLSVGYMGVVPQLENAAKNIANGDRKYVKVGDVVINGRSDRMGAVGLSKYEGGVSLVYHILRPKFDFENKFFHYLFRNKMFSQEFYKHGNGIVADLWTTKDSELKRIQAPTPPKQTQQKIVEFLDEKTEAVAELVEKKKKMIELLKEKRLSLITHAVTKGLPARRSLGAGGDENGKCSSASGRKDSGVEWIGEIPSGWKIKKLKFIFKNIVGRRKFHNQIALENIESWTGKYIETENKYSGEGTPFSKGDILFGKLRPYLVKVFLAESDGEAGGDILVFRAKNEILSGFGHKMLLSKNVIDYINASTYGTKMPRANPDFIHSLHMIYPTKQTQQKIVEFLDKETSKIDKVISKIEKQIELLDEYKASLIYHAVTGKIEV